MRQARIGTVAACTFALLLLWMGVGTAGCGQATEVLQLGDAITGDESATSSTTVPVVGPAIEVSGEAALLRPQGKVLFAARWGSAEGEFGYDVWDRGVPSQNPIEIAVSRDNKTIAILDYAHRRVQVYSYNGFLQRVISSPTEAGLADVTFGQDGRIYILTYGDSVVQLPSDSGLEATEWAIASGIWPQELIVDGVTTWVRGVDNKAYQVIQNGAPLSPEEQMATSRRGFPAAGIAFEARLVNKAAAVVQLTEVATGHSLEVPVASQALPLDSIQALGTDGGGNIYVMARIYDEGWTGTESWCFIGVTREGTSLGQLRLPLDFWAGGGWTVTPEGKILELRSTKDGIEVVEYELAGRPAAPALRGSG